jgi:hypothetical protein
MRRSALPLLAACAVVAAPAATAAAPTQSQTLFGDTLVKDAKTTSAVKKLLRSGAGFVDPEIAFADLTGDGKSDAVVLVRTAGAAGAVAVYLFSTDGAKPGAKSEALRVVFRSQLLYRATTQVRGATLVLRTPHWARGEDFCCPAKVTQRSYVWDPATKTLTRRDIRDIPGPGAPPQAPAAG